MSLKRLPQALLGHLLSGRLFRGTDSDWDHVRQVEYEAILADARSQGEELMGDIRDSGFLTASTEYRDRDGDPLIIITGQYVDPLSFSRDILRQYVYLTAEHHGLARKPFSVLFIHTGTTIRNNSPGLSWLWRSWERLPAGLHANLKRCYILHADWVLRGGLSLGAPKELYEKICYVARIEYLADHVHPDTDLDAILPPFVLHHDDILEEHPLFDYGVLDVSRIMPGSPLNPPL